MARRMSEDDQASETEEPAGNLAQRGDEDNHPQTAQARVFARGTGVSARQSQRTEPRAVASGSAIRDRFRTRMADPLATARGSVFAPDGAQGGRPPRLVFFTRPSRGGFKKC